MVLIGVFLFNLLCGLVPCDPNFGYPQVSEKEPLKDDKKDIPARVTIPNGELEGYHMKTVGARTIFAFEGIRYGSAERWKSPKPQEKWDGIWKAMKPGADCLQLSAAKFVRVYGSENCHFLNVFAPDIPYKGTSPNYPVIIYFHSGSFFMGSGSEHGPAYLLDQDVILVTVNYRLGVLGFLSNGDKSMSGNFGLKDQALAIKWVSDNIRFFGGDPSNINLVGYSAGGISVNLHMMSNKTKHLFKRGASFGVGTSFQHWAVFSRERADYYGSRLAKRVNCPGTRESNFVECMRKVNVNTLVAEQLNLVDWFPFPGVLMAPVVESEDYEEAFLTELPEEAYRKGNVERKPWIVGTTSHEGLTPVLVLELFMRWLPFRLSWKDSLKSFLDFGYLNEDNERISRKIMDYYLGDKSPISGNQFEYAQMMTHRYFHFGMIKGLQAHSEIAPTYAYYFSFRKGRYSMGNLFGHRSSEWAPGHAEDEYYWFNTTTQHPGFRDSDPDYKMAKVMANLLANFVTSGEPSYVTEDGESLNIWEPIKPSNNNKTNIRMLQLDQEVKMIDYPDMEQLKFWQDLKLKDMVAWVPLK